MHLNPAHQSVKSCVNIAETLVMLFKEDIEDGEPVITVEYHPVKYGKDYDIANNPNEFQLYVDGKEIEE